MDDLATTILKGMAAKKFSREELAFRSGVGLSTLHKIFNGSRLPTDKLLIKLGQALEIELIDQARSIATDVAPADLGAYSRASVEWMENAYLAIRYSFQVPNQIVAFALSINWASGHLAFISSDDFTAPALQRGKVSHSTRTGHSYLVVNELGRFDVTILSRPGESGRLCGLCITTILQRGVPTPASSPILLVPMDANAALPKCGPITTGDEDFENYSDWLRSVEQDGFARVVSAVGNP